MSDLVFRFTLELYQNSNISVFLLHPTIKNALPVRGNMYVTNFNQFGKDKVWLPNINPCPLLMLEDFSSFCVNENVLSLKQNLESFRTF